MAGIFNIDAFLSRMMGSPAFDEASLDFTRGGAGPVPDTRPSLDMTKVAQPPAPVNKSALGYRLGHGAATGVKTLTKAAGPVGAGMLVAEGVMGPATNANVIRTGVGLGALAVPSVGLPLAAGMATAGAIGDVYDAIAQPGASNILAPGFKKTVEAAGGTDAYIKSLPFATPSRPATQVGPGSERSIMGPSAADSVRTIPAASVLDGLPRGGAVGAPVQDPTMPFGQRGGFSAGDMESINARVRAVNANPAAIAEIDARAVAPRAYISPDGKTMTTNYKESEQYLSAKARADKDEALGGREAHRLENARLDVRNATSQAGLVKATRVLEGMEKDKATAATNAISIADLQRKGSADAAKLILDATSTGADVAKKGAETKALSARMVLAERAEKAGKSPNEVAAILAGHATGSDSDSWKLATPSAIPGGPMDLFNPKTAEGRTVTPGALVQKGDVWFRPDGVTRASPAEIKEEIKRRQK